MCGSLLSLLALLSAASSSPISSFLFLLFFLLVIGDLLSSGRRSSSFLLEARRGVVTLESNDLSRERERGRLFIPTDVERVAIPRGEPPWSCKSYEQDIRKATNSRGGKRPRKLGWGRGVERENVRPVCGKASRPPCVTANGISIETISIKSLFRLL